MKSATAPPPRSNLSLWVRVGALAATLLAVFLLVRFTPVANLLSEQGLSSFLAEVRGAWWAPVALIGLYVVSSLLGLPATPLVVGGAVFGALQGTGYNIVGLMLGATVSFLFGRTLGRDVVVRLTGPKIRRVERLLGRHGFLPLVQTRFLPLPFSLVNYGAALAGVRLTRFLAATLIGVVPSTVIYTILFSELLAGNGERRVLLFAIYIGGFTLVNALLGGLWLRKWTRRRKRHRELLARRAARRDEPYVPAVSRGA